MNSSAFDGNDTAHTAQQTQALLAAAVAHSIDSIVITTADAANPLIVYVNPAFTKMTGYDSAEVLGKNPRFMQGPRTDRSTIERLKASLADGTVFTGEALNYRKDGSEFYNQWHIEPIFGAAGAIEHFLAVQRDVTERHMLQQQLFQAQKLESMGLMAAGIAHDFNNILSTVLGYAQLGLERMPEGAPGRPEISAVAGAAQTGVALTRRLLNICRKSPQSFNAVQINNVILNLTTMLSRLFSKQIKLELALDPALPAVRADAAQLEQLVLNAAINARDAMPKGGVLHFSTQPVTLEQPLINFGMTVAAGACVRISVSDTGEGMSAATQARLFEPFYTTKPEGKGTGLGMSIIRAVLQQHKGCLLVRSQEGQGTTLEFLLPANP